MCALNTLELYCVTITYSSLEYSRISSLSHSVLPGHFQTFFDDKSGYDHVHLHPSSSTFFGLQWKGWYFVFTTIPFGWKASAFVYHSIGMAATNYIHSLGVPCSQYIDDRHCGQLCLSFTQSSYSGFALAEMAAFIAWDISSISRNACSSPPPLWDSWVILIL